MSGPILEARGVAVRRADRPVLELERLELRRGETLALVGRNGSGKSTLLSTLALLLRPERGEIRFDGRLVAYRRRELLRLRRRMAVVLQEPLLCSASVFDNVALGLGFRGLPRREISRRVGAWLERLDIAHLEGRPAGGLSGGEAQRASLARALVLEPEVLFLDEPFSSLDPPTRDALVTDLNRILQPLRTTVVLATHERGEALSLGDRVAVIVDGAVAQIDAPEAVFQRPASEEVARFVGVETLIPGRVTASSGGLVRVEAQGCHLEIAGEAAAGDAVLVCLRPEQVSLALKAPEGGSSVRNCLQGRVSRLTPSASQMRVAIDCAVPVVALVTGDSARSLELEEGTPVFASFKASAAHLIPRRPPR